MTTAVWEHQREAARHLHRCLGQSGGGSAIFAGMGSGKTRMVLHWLGGQDLACKRILILAPKSVVNNVWAEEFEKYSGDDWRCLTLGTGSLARRLERLQQADAEMKKMPTAMARLAVVLNYDVVHRPEALKILGAVPWNVLVLDESHRISSPGGKTSRVVRRLARDIPLRIALTGTPISGSAGPLGIWAQYAALDPTIFHRTFTEFRAAYTEPCQWGQHNGALPPRGGGTPQPWRFHNLADLERRMASIAWQVETTDVLDLPPVVDVERVCELEPAAKRAYKELEKELITDLRAGVVTATNALTRLLRLQQLTGGWLRTDEGVYEEVSKAKKKLLADVLEDLPLADPLVVVCRFHKDMDNVRDVCEAAGRDFYELSGRIDQLRAWKSMCHYKQGSPVLAMQIQAGGLGISLVEAHTAIWYSLGYSLTDYDQARARLHRPGQESPVTNVHLVTRGTVDVDVYKALQSRADLIDAVLQRVELATTR